MKNRLDKKSFAVRHPYLCGIIAFLLFFVSGTLVGVILVLVIMSRSQCSPGDICDGAAMAAGFIWPSSMIVSCISGAVVGSLTFIYLKSKRKDIYN